ncbi:MAG: hypothetical protein COY37_08180, partial [Candidatus Aquicultor secundus]
MGKCREQKRARSLLALTRHDNLFYTGKDVWSRVHTICKNEEEVLNMAMRRFDPWRDLMRMQEDLNRLFHKTFGPEPEAEAMWMPSADIYQKENKLIVTMDLPDVDPKDIDVSVVENTLRIKGERKHTEEAKKENYYRSERFYGSFERVIELPMPVKTEDVEATYKDGVLTIDLPVAEEKKG